MDNSSLGCCLGIGSQHASVHAASMASILVVSMEILLMLDEGSQCLLGGSSHLVSGL